MVTFLLVLAVVTLAALLLSLGLMLGSTKPLKGGHGTGRPGEAPGVQGCGPSCQCAPSDPSTPVEPEA